MSSLEQSSCIAACYKKEKNLQSVHQSRLTLLRPHLEHRNLTKQQKRKTIANTTKHLEHRKSQNTLLYMKQVTQKKKNYS